MGHDVLISLEAGNANAAVPDVDVLAFAIAESRILTSLNRRDFLRIHSRGDLNHCGIDHCGIVACTFDPDFVRQAHRIHEAVVSMGEMRNQLVRVNRPG
jgi:hypothetical protein